MLVLLVVLLLLFVVLTAALWFGTLFMQSFLYTEPTSGIAWQAPASAGALTGFLLIWSLINVVGGNAEADKEIPYPVVWRFSNRIKLNNEPVPQFETKKKKAVTGPRIFKREKIKGTYEYKHVDSDEMWSFDGVEYVAFTLDGVQYKCLPVASEGRYRKLVDPNHSSWEMREIEMGILSSTSFLRLVIYAFLNLTHLVIWIVCLWLVLRFAPNHAVGFGLVLWLAFTLAIFPGLFGRAQQAVKPTAQATPAAWHWA